MIDLTKLAEWEKRKVEAMTPAEAFRFFVLKLADAHYVLGRENLFATDCSGTICWALFCMGLNIRTTAQGLFDTVFLHMANRATLAAWGEKVLAIFYRHKDDGLRVTHVQPVVGRGVVFDAATPTLRVGLKDLDQSMEWYTENGYEALVREIDWAAANEVAQERTAQWDLNADAMLKSLLEEG